MKNPALCERPYCRECWTHIVSGFNERRKRGWQLRVCAAHAKEYQDIDPRDVCNGVYVNV